MHILIANFRPNGVSYELLVAVSVESAAFINEMPGFIEKTHLWDEETQMTGGVYKFKDKASVDAYLASDFWVQGTSDPSFQKDSVRTFAALEEATHLTHGFREVAVG